MPAFTLYIGIDWETQTHQVCIMDVYRTILREFVVDHTGESVREFRRSLEATNVDSYRHRFWLIANTA